MLLGTDTWREWHKDNVQYTVATDGRIQLTEIIEEGVYGQELFNRSPIAVDQVENGDNANTPFVDDTDFTDWWNALSDEATSTANASIIETVGHMKRSENTTNATSVTSEKTYLHVISAQPDAQTPATEHWLHIYDKAGVPNPAVDTPVASYHLRGTPATHLHLVLGNTPLILENGLAYIISKDYVGSGAADLNGVMLNIRYKV